jgi:hypothetical protein
VALAVDFYCYSFPLKFYPMKTIFIFYVSIHLTS